MSGGVPGGVNVTQDDRDAAADYFAAIGDPARAKVARRGEYDLAAAVQHFAAYRRRLATPTPPPSRDADVERVEAAVRAVERLAHTPMQLSVAEWSDVSSAILAALNIEPYRSAALQALGERG